MVSDLKIAILNGYPKASRERFDAANVGHPHDMYADFLRRYVPSVTLDVLFIADLGTTLPSGASLTSYDAYVWTGSDLTIYHGDDERVTRQIELSRAIFEAGVPCYGSCWGVQRAAGAAGGEVRKNPRGREWSIARRIRRTDAGRESLLLRGKPDVYDPRLPGRCSAVRRGQAGHGRRGVQRPGPGAGLRRADRRGRGGLARAALVF